jgi:hypothetical protein
MATSTYSSFRRFSDASALAHVWCHRLLEKRAVRGVEGGEGGCGNLV